MYGIIVCLCFVWCVAVKFREQSSRNNTLCILCLSSHPLPNILTAPLSLPAASIALFIIGPVSERHH